MSVEDIRDDYNEDVVCNDFCIPRYSSFGREGVGELLDYIDTLESQIRQIDKELDQLRKWKAEVEESWKLGGSLPPTQNPSTHF